VGDDDLAESIKSNNAPPPLGNELRRLREAAGLTIERVAEVLDCSTSKISRIETGQVSVRGLDLRTILDIYDVAASDRASLIELARKTPEKGLWQAHGELKNLRALVDFEVAASSIRTFGGLLLPGLLQTAEYARAVMGALRPELRSEELDHWVTLRLARQALLTGDDPPSYWAILDDAALRRDVGGRRVMERQLQFLAEMAALRNVTLQLLPSTKGAHAGLCGDFTIFSFSEPNDQDVIYLEHNAGDLYLEQREQVIRHVQAFDHLRAKALGPEESLLILTQAYSGEADQDDDVLDPA